VAASGSTRAVLAALFANAGIAVAKFVGFAFTGSSSMLAESIHSVADTSNQALLLWGGRAARMGPDERFQFGRGRERYFWSFIVAMVLFTLGSLFALYEGVEKIRHPHELSSAGWAIGILGVAIVLESWSFRTAVVESRHIKRPGQSWWEFVRQCRTPELPVVLLEDLGALIGLFLALSAVTLTVITGDPVWDGVGTLGIGLLLGAIAVTLAYEMKQSLIGEAATREDEAKLVAAIESAPQVRRLIHLRSQHLGPDELLVAAKVEFDHELTFSGLAEAVDSTEKRLREAVPVATMIYLEPDLYELSRVTGEAGPTGRGAPGGEAR
jgi:cation diffusion facilitator family transporter